MGTPHDILIRFVLADRRHAASWLRSMLPRAIARAIDWSTLRPCPASIAGRDLRLHHADLLFVVNLEAGGRVFLLVEHKSRHDPDLKDQLLRYAVHIRQRGRERRGGPPALVVAFVLFHGEQPWPATARQQRHLIALDPAAARVLVAAQPTIRFFLDDLHSCSERDLRRRRLTPLVRLALLCLRFLRQFTVEQAVAAVDRWGDLLRQVDRDRGPGGGQGAIDAISSYFLRVAEVPAETLHEAFERNLQRPEESIMSTAEKLLKEGEARGEARGRSALLLRMLTARFGQIADADRRRLEQATCDELDRWAVRLLDAGSLADVFTAP